jgi:four helix bundle protein
MPGARAFTQLVSWQLADALRQEVLKLTGRPPLANRWKTRDQVEDAVDSVCRNIAEGFGAETHAGFAAYLRISRRSLNELRDAFRSALQKRFATAQELAAAFSLMHRLFPALNNFIAYLERTPNYRHRPRQPRTDGAKPVTDTAKPRRRDRAKRPGTDRAKRPRTDTAKQPRTDKR